MVNYALIEHVRLGVQRAHVLFSEAVQSCFGSRLRLTKFLGYGPTWFITAPGTAVGPSEAEQASVSPGRDFGFTISLTGRDKSDVFHCIEFRRPLNHWEWWAQGCVMEDISCKLDKPYFLDATNKIHFGCHPWFGNKSSYREWVEDRSGLSVDTIKEATPEGWW